MKQEILDEVYNDYIHALDELRGIEDEILSVKSVLAKKKTSAAEIKKRIKTFVNIFRSYSTQFISFDGTYLTVDMALKFSKGDKEAKAFAKKIGIVEYEPWKGQKEGQKEGEKANG